MGDWLPAFAPDVAYEERLHAACATLDAVTTRQDFREAVAKFDPSDAILFIATECHPAEPLDLRDLVGKRAPRAVLLLRRRRSGGPRSPGRAPPSRAGATRA